MAIAIVSDIHSNLEALQAVLEDIKSNSIDRIYCLGDMIGYGPDPKEVLIHAMKWDMVVQGNHDAAALWNVYGFNPTAQEAIKYTKKEIGSFIFKSRFQRFIASLPILYRDNDAIFLHGSPRDPLMEYILKQECKDVTGKISIKLTDIFSRIERLLFAGHTHFPGIINQDGDFVSQQEIQGRYRLNPTQKYIINAGSVGQPRDGDPRASYAIFDGETIQFRRIKYDHNKTMKKILNTQELDKRLADRLTLGK